VPAGVKGELYVGGAGVGRGYLNRPELTLERFIPDPFAVPSGGRLYRTGDLARYLPDGNLEFVGRIDHQVKVRGFRIELGEIEAALNQHPSIQECVVLAREDTPGEKRLVAYVISSPDTPATSSDLRGWVGSRLPEYMIPQFWVTLDSLPLTANGKVDRQALPAPDSKRPELKESYVAPRNRVERLLTEVWEQVLGVQRVGVHDNFFELGGDSIRSILVIARANKQGLRLSPKLLFQHQTISELAAELPVDKTAGENIRDAARTKTGGFTPSDFPHARVSQKDLNLLIAGMSRASESKP